MCMRAFRLIRTVLKKTVIAAVRDGMNPVDCEPEGPEGCVEECGLPLEHTKQMLAGG